MYDQGRPMESLRLGLVDGLCFLGGIFMIFMTKAVRWKAETFGLLVGVWVAYTQVAKPT